MAPSPMWRCVLLSTRISADRSATDPAAARMPTEPKASRASPWALVTERPRSCGALVRGDQAGGSGASACLGAVDPAADEERRLQLGTERRGTGAAELGLAAPQAEQGGARVRRLEAQRARPVNVHGAWRVLQPAGRVGGRYHACSAVAHAPHCHGSASLRRGTRRALARPEADAGFALQLEAPDGALPRPRHCVRGGAIARCAARDSPLGCPPSSRRHPARRRARRRGTPLRPPQSPLIRAHPSIAWT